MTRRWVAASIVVFAGCLGGAALLSRRAPTRDAPAHDGPARAGAVDVRRGEPFVSTFDPRVGPLLAMNAALAERIERVERGHGTDSPEEGEPARAAERSSSLARERSDYADLASAHERAKVDPAWAEPTAALLHDELVALAEAVPGTSLARVECRSDSCIARLDFSSRKRAQAEAARLVGHPYGVNCATRIQLNEATDPDAPYRLELILHGCIPEPA